MSKELAKVYREATLKIANGASNGCCFAICSVTTGGLYFVARRHFCDFFREPFAPTYWWPDFSKKSQLARLIALDLMAEMAESGDL